MHDAAPAQAGPRKTRKVRKKAGRRRKKASKASDVVRLALGLPPRKARYSPRGPDPAPARRVREGALPGTNPEAS